MVAVVALLGEVPKWEPEVVDGEREHTIAAPKHMSVAFTGCRCSTGVTWRTNVATSTPVDPEAEISKIAKVIRDN